MSFATPLFAQANASLPPALGMDNPWDVRTIVDGVIKDNEQFQPILNGLHPQDWASAKGASTVYIQQWQQALQQTKDVVTVSRMLKLNTDSLSLAMDDYFRLEALDITSRSLEEGIRRYDDRATAEKLSAIIAHNFTARERFRDYVRGLAGSMEQNFKIADSEAQRCRGIISKEPAPKKPAKK